MRTIDDLGDLRGKRVLLRSDLNVPLEDGQVADDGRIRASVPTITRLADAGVSHGFCVVHGKQASVYDLARRLPHAAGDLGLAEVRAVAKVLDEPDRPYVVVLGGSKVSDKLGVIDNLLGKVDRLLVGGGMCFTFLKAQGNEVGGSLVEEDQVGTVRGFVDRAAQSGVDLVLPVDIVVATEVTEDASTDVVSAGAIPRDQKGLDIGPATVRFFRDKLADARTVVWNGPMGVFELSPFATGTREIAEAVAAIDGTSLVGGGGTPAAVRQLGLDESSFTHISTGGGGPPRLSAGEKLPGGLGPEEYMGAPPPPPPI